MFTTIESERLIRLPMYYGLNEKDIKKVCEVINDFFNLKTAKKIKKKYNVDTLSPNCWI